MGLLRTVAHRIASPPACPLQRLRTAARHIAAFTYSSFLARDAGAPHQFTRHPSKVGPQGQAPVATGRPPRRKPCPGLGLPRECAAPTHRRFEWKDNLQVKAGANRFAVWNSCDGGEAYRLIYPTPLKNKRQKPSRCFSDSRILQTHMTHLSLEEARPVPGTVSELV